MPHRSSVTPERSAPSPRSSAAIPSIPFRRSAGEEVRGRRDRDETGAALFQSPAPQAAARQQCRHRPMRCRIGRLPYRKWCTHTPPSRHPPERDHSTVKNERTLKNLDLVKAGEAAIGMADRTVSANQGAAAGVVQWQNGSFPSCIRGSVLRRSSTAHFQASGFVGSLQLCSFSLICRIRAFAPRRGRHNAG